jgi:hypothetical protein
MPFVRQRRQRVVGRAAVSEHGAEDVAAGIGRCSGAARGSRRPFAGLRLAPFHHAAMVLPAQTPRQGRLPASLRDGLRPALTRTLVRQIGSAMRKGRGSSAACRHGVPGPPGQPRLLEKQCGRGGSTPVSFVKQGAGGGWR